MQRVNQDQDIIQINNNVKTLAMAKEPYGFSKGSENPSGCSKTKKQNLSLIRHIMLNKLQQKNDDA